MSALTAPTAAAAPRRMSVWTASWSLLGGAIVGSIAAGMLELPLAAAAAGLAAVALLGYLTHSWWSVLAIVPAAFVVRYAARPPAVRSRRRVLVAGAAALVYLAFVGARSPTCSTIRWPHPRT